MQMQVLMFTYTCKAAMCASASARDARQSIGLILSDEDSKLGSNNFSKGSLREKTKMNEKILVVLCTCVSYT